MKNHLMAGLWVAGMITLGGCSTQWQQPSQSTANLTLDKQANYQPAQSVKQARAQVVNHYVPVAMPGQLMPTPTSDPQQKKPMLKQEAAVEQANKQALVTPNSDNFFNAMATYHYMPGALYMIYTAPLKITDIALQPGEKIISEAAGDTLRWQVSQTYSGSGSTMQQHVLVKPNEADLQNSLLITTDKRVYHLVLSATDNGAYMAAVSWDYPSDMVQFSEDMQNPDNMASSAQAAPYSLSLGGLNFDYKFGLVKGSKPSWYPERVFSDGHQTYIKLSGNAGQDNNLPVLYVADDQGNYGTMVNWHLHWPYLIVDSIIDKAQLRSGVESKDNVTIVQIEKTQG